jgi:diguanylate cyclase (GGDEF)-like protein/PAS domain S-box-containing protein
MSAGQVACASSEEQALRDEIVRLNKMLQALMNRAERSTSVHGSDFGLFQTAIVLEDQVRRRTEDLEAALRENEKINRALQRATLQMEAEIGERRRVQDALRQSEERYRAATEAAIDAFVTIDENSVIVFVNAAVERIFGYPPDEMLGQPLSKMMPPDLRERHRLGMQRYLETGQKKLSWQGTQLPCLHKSGHIVPIEFSFGEFTHEGKRFFTGIARDITKRKRAEALREGQQRALELIAVDAPLDEALNVLMRCIESQVDGLLCSVLLLGNDGRHIRSAVAPSLPHEYANAFIGLAIGPDVGSCGTAMHRRTPVIVRDIEVDPLWEQYRTTAAPFGLRACWSTPILAVSGQVLGAFAMYYREPREPDDAEMKLIELAVYIARIAVERKLNEAYIRHIAHHDTLTGLPNRLLLEDRLKQAVAQAHRRRAMVAVLFVDLDHFKAVNDSLGHQAGDLLLQAVAERMQQCLREGDSVARLGGDEFVICLPEIDSDNDAALVAEKIQRLLANPLAIGDHMLQVGSSIGISMYPHDGENADALIKAADAAMYDAKSKGRSNYQFYTPKLNAKAHQRLAVTNQLRQALVRNEMVLHYQPQVSLASGEITGVEALLRWNHPEHGLLPPSDFIPILEEIGMMSEVGGWVLRTACARNAEWQRAGLPPIRMAVNLSARQFVAGSLVRVVAEALDKHRLEARWLDLEITEGLLLASSEQVTESMTRLKNMGVGLSLDDFGTGYSSLSYLRSFPVQRLKIDRSFIHDITTDAGSANIVASIIALSQKMDLEVVAEGVETEEQRRYLQRQGCHEIQGFLFSPALPANEIESMLRARRRLPA